MSMSLTLSDSCICFYLKVKLDPYVQTKPLRVEREPRTHCDETGRPAGDRATLNAARSHETTSGRIEKHILL